MPKRDEGYMDAQRGEVAKAALSVLVEKGYYETSLRDICRAAGISNGALYSYFPTRESVILAACTIDPLLKRQDDVPSDWVAYSHYVTPEDLQAESYRSRRFRLSLQFAAAITQMEPRPEGLDEVYAIHRDNIREALQALSLKEIISMPFGLEMTTDIHMQIFTGFEYQRRMGPHESSDAIIAAFHQALASTAGLIEK